MSAGGPSPVTVVLEPSGMEYVLQPGDHFEFEWEDVTGDLIGTIDHQPHTITIGEGSGRARMWNSNGDELSMLG
ncbi:hypothetical protein [Antribacter gilvus]|uniref:hypothetical protein n=1 Tax=Antribacter gilvus TaxID=2304675 RepID=UPI000F79FB97|nr:hypothetical protein [Antribacter gilvus]